MTTTEDPQVVELRARRLVAQHLASRHRLSSALEVVQHLLAIQGQLHNSGIQAISCRCAEGEEGVEKLLAASQIVRTWSQRGTHHYLAAEDARWMMRLCSPRVEAAAKKRRPGLGLTEEMFESARDVLCAALAEGPVSRTEAYSLIAAAGVDPGNQCGPHILRSLGSVGDIVQAPRRKKEDVFMLVEQLPVAQRELEGDAALAELGTRYFRSRGPATVKDLAWWSGLTMVQAKRAAALAEGVVPVQLAGVEYLMADWQLGISDEELRDGLSQRYKLPAFDEYLLGYQDRSAVCPPELVPVVGPTRNGVCRPFVVEHGVVTGVGEQ
ncbi:winged helix DNA-binding domain-containing protein [Staphylococcus chromogenes]|nr:winged helix DNA-binding domain-containing protein [Staphylococcus chromogenes]